MSAPSAELGLDKGNAFSTLANGMAVAMAAGSAPASFFLLEHRKWN
jgi:hypothetical protein